MTLWLIALCYATKELNAAYSRKNAEVRECWHENHKHLSCGPGKNLLLRNASKKSGTSAGMSKT